MQPLPPITRRMVCITLLAAGVAACLRGADQVILPDRGICAHRGGSATHPENTLSAFREAVRLGAHMVELDVAITQDGALVLMHDATVNRTTDGKGRVLDFTLAALKRLDAGAWKDSRFAGTRVPSLEEATLAIAQGSLIGSSVMCASWLLPRCSTQPLASTRMGRR